MSISKTLKFVKGIGMAFLETAEDAYIALRDLTPLIIVAGEIALFGYLNYPQAVGVLLPLAFIVGVGLSIYRSFHTILSYGNIG